jgi:hypothetical protein
MVGNAHMPTQFPRGVTVNTGRCVGDLPGADRVLAARCWFPQAQMHVPQELPLTSSLERPYQKGHHDWRDHPRSIL